MSPAGGGMIGPIPAGSDPDEYDRLRRRVLWLIPNGLYLLGARSAERANLMTCSWVTQVALEPKLLAVSVERAALTHALVRASGAFALSLLEREDRVVVRRFAKPAEHDSEGHTLAGFAYRDAPATGSPVLAQALAWVDCRVTNEVELGSHTLFVGEVEDAGFGDSSGAPRQVEDAGPYSVLRMEDTRMNYGG